MLLQKLVTIVTFAATAILAAPTIKQETGVTHHDVVKNLDYLFENGAMPNITLSRRSDLNELVTEPDGWTYTCRGSIGGPMSPNILQYAQACDFAVAQPDSATCHGDGMRCNTCACSFGAALKLCITQKGHTATISTKNAGSIGLEIVRLMLEDYVGENVCEHHSCANGILCVYTGMAHISESTLFTFVLRQGCQNDYVDWL